MSFIHRKCELTSVLQAGRFVLLLAAMTMASDLANAARGSRRYPSLPHNSDFMTSCTRSKPTVYNPNINNRMEGGGKNRFGEKITSIEDAAKTGQPVTVAMDYKGAFGKRCNQKAKRCLLLVHLPGLDKTYPAYGKKFPNLPKDSFIAIVEDTGGAFVGKGTGKMDIAFRTKGLENRNSFSQLKFEVLESGKGDRFDSAKGASIRKSDLSHFKPFLGGRDPKCQDWEVSRRQDQAPSVNRAPSSDYDGFVASTGE